MAVAAVALPATLTACGSDEEGGDTVVSATATETSTHAAAPGAEGDPKAAGKDDPNAPKDDPAAGKAAGAAGAAGAPQDPNAPLANPFKDPNFQVPTHEPLASGAGGSDEDKKQMEEVLYASLNPPSADQWTRSLLDNTCARVANPVREEMNRSGYSLEQIEQAMRLQEQAGRGLALPHSDVALEDVRVDGNRASATATVTSNGESDTQVQIFEREDGRWKLCD